MDACLWWLEATYTEILDSCLKHSQTAVDIVGMPFTLPYKCLEKSGKVYVFAQISPAYFLVLPPLITLHEATLDRRSRRLTY